MARFASNNIEDFEEGGLYPGGTGVIEDIKYVLWDYDGKQPKDSVIAVYMKFQPTDGSNEGKPVDNYWAAGNDVKSFAPDPTGGHLVILGTREKQSKSSNWAHVLETFNKNCGLEGSRLQGTDGIRALIRTEMTVIRIDQPTREGLDKDKDAAKEPKKFKPTYLVPTKAKFPWEKGGRSTSTSAPAPAPSASTAAPASTAAASNGAAGEVSTDLSILIADIAKSEGGIVVFADLGKKLMDKLNTVDRSVRVGLIKQSKDVDFITKLANENAWTFDGKELVI